MRHSGDITAISGYDAPPVDVIIGGSPCQDLSAAGKRAGLAGVRSGLFMEQIRLIKELRNADMQRGWTGQFIRPRFMLWENVPGAFSSNKGNDFRAVLEETIRIAEPDAPNVPLPAKEKWPLADCWMGDGWSIAYRVLDAQFWGVLQRRRRIALVADFGGHAAPEILFVRKSVCGDTAAGGTPGEETAAGTGSGTYPTIARSLTARYNGSPCIDRGHNIVWCLQGNCVDRPDTASCNGRGWKADASYTLNTVDRHAVCVPINTMAATRCGADDGRMCFGIGEPGDPQYTISAAHCHAVYQAASVHRNQCAGFKPNAGAKAGNIGYKAETAPTLNAEQTTAVYDARGNGNGKTVCTLTGDNQRRVTDYMAIVMATGQTGAEIIRDMVPTLNCNHEQPIISHGAAGIVRRLTPLECERLQGYPDGWTDIGAWIDSRGKLHKESSDAARYRALGNSIAIPPWAWVLKRLCGCYERPATMASLFDGIGGFPLIWERLNGPGSCLWASEIEEFPIAVTKQHFGKENAIP